MNHINIHTDLKNLDFNKLLKIVSILIPLAIAGNVIYAIIASEPGILEMLGNFKPGYLLLAMGMVLVPLVTHSLRMWLWARTFKQELKPSQAFKTSIAAEIGSAATPTIVGGGYIKLLFLIGYGFSPARATLITALGTIEDITFFALTLPPVIYFSHAWNNPYVINAVKNFVAHWPIVAVAIITLLIIAVILKKFNSGNNQRPGEATVRQSLWSKVIGRLKNFQNDLGIASKYVVKRGKGTLAVCTILGGIGWTSRYAAINALILGLGLPVDPLLYTLLHWVVFSTMTLIPTPGAIGGAEVSFAIIFSGIIPPSAIPVMTGVWRFVTFYMAIAGGAIYLAIAGLGFSHHGETSSETKPLNEVAIKHAS